MKFISLFAGIGGFDRGFERAGMECVGYAEMDKYSSQVMAKHWPDVPNYGDVRNVREGTVDLICGGFPCQDVSVAGKRAGLAGERSGLWGEFHRIIDDLHPRWVVIENVPGLLSSNGGRDMGAILGALAELRYGYAYAVLDAQYFGLAQRRKRVFIVANSTDWHYPAKVLFEPESCERDTAPSRETGEGIASTLRAGAGAIKHNADARGRLVIGSLQARDYKGVGNQYVAEGKCVVQPFSVNTVDDKRKDRPNGGMYVKKIDTALTPSSKGQTLVASYWDGGQLSDTLDSSMLSKGQMMPDKRRMPAVVEQFTDVTACLTSAYGTKWNGNRAAETGELFALEPQVGVRRLTPLECERLQGFPDGWTDIVSDTQRYKQLGNAVAVPVAEWIGKRIMEAL